jgi:GNAT superfamily N-acetyltransferase
MPITVTFLELRDPAQIRPPATPPARRYELERIDDPDTSRWFYEHVGANHSWVDRLSWTPEQWRERAAQGESWMASVGGERAGFYSFRLNVEPVEIDVFGLLPKFHGLGLGGHLLTDALHRGFELGDRVWLHTCTLDSPQALPNYEARGMRVFKRERRG